MVMDNSSVPIVVAAVPVIVATVAVVVATVSEVAAAYDVAMSERSSIHAARSVDSGRRTRTHPLNPPP
jgi:phage-related minor tail protein